MNRDISPLEGSDREVCSGERKVDSDVLTLHADLHLLPVGLKPGMAYFESRLPKREVCKLQPPVTVGGADWLAVKEDRCLLDRVPLLVVDRDKHTVRGLSEQGGDKGLVPAHIHPLMIIVVSLYPHVDLVDLLPGQGQRDNPLCVGDTPLDAVNDNCRTGERGPACLVLHKDREPVVTNEHYLDGLLVTRDLEVVGEGAVIRGSYLEVVRRVARDGEHGCTVCVRDGRVLPGTVTDAHTCPRHRCKSVGIKDLDGQRYLLFGHLNEQSRGVEPDIATPGRISQFFDPDLDNLRSRVGKFDVPSAI
ncbi:MAG: hypothetical protein A4E41_01534 [Methanoregulaceae archaeon PtaU1.Bin066]|nr:MAG: hypothetical protein A4E41_01534 [Methanoregulaceae archaeon PtaU1.Bin066]